MRSVLDCLVTLWRSTGTLGTKRKSDRENGHRSILNLVGIAEQLNEIRLRQVLYLLGMFSVESDPRDEGLRWLRLLGLNGIDVLPLITQSALRAFHQRIDGDRRISSTLGSDGVQITEERIHAEEEWLQQTITPLEKRKWTRSSHHMLFNVRIQTNRTCLQRRMERHLVSPTCRDESHMKEISIAFISAVLTVELIELGFRSIDFTGIAVRHERQIDDVQHGSVGIPDLCRRELTTIGTQCFVVNSEVNAIVLVPDERRTLLSDLRSTESVEDQAAMLVRTSQAAAISSE